LGSKPVRAGGVQRGSNLARVQFDKLHRGRDFPNQSGGIIRQILKAKPSSYNNSILKGEWEIGGGDAFLAKF
jgi:poly(3-hydroxyalkanoate) synthetase